MRFYIDWVRRLDIPRWEIFSKIYEPQLDLKHFASMTPEEEKEEHNRLLEEHKAKIRKSDYLIVINKDGYIGDGVKEEIAYADEIGLGILYTEYVPGYTYIGEIWHNGHPYYLISSKSHYMKDDITECDDFIISNNVKMIRLAAVPDKPNVNHIQYSTDSIIKALKAERIQALFSIDGLRVEWGSSLEKYNEGSFRLVTISPSMTVGSVVALGSKYLFIRPNTRFEEIFGESDGSDLIAYMRYTGKVRKREDGSDISDVTDINITTWDIWYNGLNEEYLNSIE